MYQLTEIGRERARLLLRSAPSKTPVEKIALSRETAKKAAKDKMVSFEHSGDLFGESDFRSPSSSS